VFKRAFGWWLLAVAACESITTPRTDVAASDRACERLLMDSALWSSCEHVAAAIDRAWPDSWITRRMRAASGSWTASEPVQRQRAVGWMMTVAALTTLALLAFSGERAPLDWMVPAAVAVAGVVVMLIADPKPAAGIEQP
jgi:hypothetical protein